MPMEQQSPLPGVILEAGSNLVGQVDPASGLQFHPVFSEGITGAQPGDHARNRENPPPYLQDFRRHRPERSVVHRSGAGA